MPARSPLVKTPPFAVEKTLRTLGANLRTARLRRNLTLTEVANRLGVDRHVLANAERGKLSTSAAVYVGALWVLGLTEQLDQVADPDRDEEGKALARAEERRHVRPGRGSLSDDF